MKYNEHIYAIQNIRNRGPKSDDHRISNRLVGHFLKISRARLQKLKLEKEHVLTHSNYQTFCMPLIETTYYDCTCLPEEVGCKILRSEVKVPKEIGRSRVSTIEIKSPVDGSKIYQSSPSMNKAAKHSLANKGVPKWFIENSYLYVLNTLDLPMVIVSGVWENPEELVNYTSCSAAEETAPCYDINEDEFPIDAELVDPMYRLTLELLAFSDRYPEDITNDAKDVQLTPTN